MPLPAMEPPTSSGPITYEARLVHAEPGRRVVELSAWRLGQCLARCLGEAEGAESAEDRALARIEQRMGNVDAIAPRPRQAPPQRIQTAPPASETLKAPDPAPPQPPSQDDSASSPQLPLLNLGTPAAEEPAPTDPDDWSEELAELDVQLQRLGWDRSQESTYLQRAFGHPSRNRLTAYADLAAYLRALRDLAAGSQAETAPVPLRRRDLLNQCDQLLASLGWDPQRGRQLLEQTFQLSSRQQLSDDQLLQFNMLLESELIGCGSGPAGAGSPD